MLTIRLFHNLIAEATTNMLGIAEAMNTGFTGKNAEIVDTALNRLKSLHKWQVKNETAIIIIFINGSQATLVQREREFFVFRPLSRFSIV